MLNSFENNAPPFMSAGEDGVYYLRGISDLANGELQDYGKMYGECKLTALNHTKTLNEIMIVLKIIEKLEEEELLNFDDIEIVNYLENELLKILVCFFGDETIKYDSLVMYAFITWNRQIVNEAIYNLVADTKLKVPLSPQQLDDSLEGEQFIDPYFSIANDIAFSYKLRPYDVIKNWSTAELVVTYAKMANDNSLNAFVNYKYSQPKAPKQQPPKKQVFYFGDVEAKKESDGLE